MTEKLHMSEEKMARLTREADVDQIYRQTAERRALTSIEDQIAREADPHAIQTKRRIWNEEAYEQKRRAAAIGQPKHKGTKGKAQQAKSPRKSKAQRAARKAGRR